MNDLLSDVSAIYRDEGALPLATKSIRKALRPVIGTGNANVIYHMINRIAKRKPILHTEFDFHQNVIGIQEDGYHTFFGFYDHTPFSPDNTKIAFNRTQNEMDPVGAEDTLEICIFDLKSLSVKKIGETKTWNWQKGCRMHWMPGEENAIIYNKIIDGSYGAVIQNTETGDLIKKVQHPIYDVGPDGRYALSIDFSRLERLHFDYGYVNFPDRTSTDPSPEDDGIFLIDLHQNESELVVSLDQLSSMTDSKSDCHDYIMNLMFSPEGNQFLFLHRYHENGSRITNLMTSSLNGDKIRVLQDTNEPSHPTWRSEDEILSTVNYWDKERRTEFMLYQVNTGEKSNINHGSLSVDSHPSFAPNSSDIFVGDTYPDSCGERHLYLFSISKGIYKKIGSGYGPVKNGIKRDLHPRWDRKGNFVCIDVPRPDYSQSVLILDVRKSVDKMVNIPD